MEIVYTEHAVERMRERNISPRHVRELMSKPKGKIKQSKDKWIFYKAFKNRRDNDLAAVIVEISGNRFEVITVMVNFEVRS